MLVLQALGMFISPMLVLQALGIDGVRALLGMRTTIGTVKEALPPPASLLLNSFSALQNPDVSFWLCLVLLSFLSLASIKTLGAPEGTQNFAKPHSSCYCLEENRALRREVKLRLDASYGPGNWSDFASDLSSFLFNMWLQIRVGLVEKWEFGGLEVAGCQISVGARALAKHVPRSLDGWWGSVTGTGTSF